MVSVVMAGNNRQIGVESPGDGETPAASAF